MSRSHDPRPGDRSRTPHRICVILIGCLAWDCSGATPRAALADTPSPFETFAVSKPDAPAPVSVSQPGSGESAGSPALSPSRRRAPTGRVQVVMTLFPGLNSIASTVTGKFGGQQIDSSLQVRDDMGHDLLNLGYLESDRGLSGVRIGQENVSGLPGSEGIRFSSPTGTAGLSMGYGLYHGVSQGSAWVPGVDAQWDRLRQTKFDAMVAADSSWRLTQATQIGNAHFASFAESDHSTRTGYLGYSAGGAVSPSSSIYQALTRSLDGRESTSSFGGTEKIGHSLIAFDSLQSGQPQVTLQERLIGLMMPMNRQWLNLRWESRDLQVRQGEGSAQSDTSFSAALHASLSPHTQLSFEATMFSRIAGAARRADYSIGGNHVFSPQWRVQASLAKEYARSTYVLNSTIEYRLSQEWQVRLLIGPSLALRTDGRQSSALGLQIVRSFTVFAQPEGVVQGTALLDGHPCPFPLSIDLDGVGAAKTDRQGRFSIRHVAEGTHSVQVDLKTLAAQFSPQENEISVAVSARHPASLSLHLATVGQVSGSIAVLANEFGERDPAAGIGVTVMDTQGHATTTDAAGHFVLGNLPQGRYTISLAQATLPQGYEIQEPQSVVVTVAPGMAISPVRFTVAPTRRDVLFSSSAP